MDDILGVTDGDPSEPSLDSMTAEPSPVSNDEGNGVAQETEQNQEEQANPDVQAAPKPNDAASNFRALREKVKQLEAQNGTLAKAKQLHDWLMGNEANAKLVQQLMSGKSMQDVIAEMSGQKQSENPYEGYDPVAAAKFKELDQLKQMLSDRQRQEEEHRAKQEEFLLNQNMGNLNSYFDDLLNKSELSGIPDSAKDLVAKATYQVLSEMLPDPRRATQEEVKEALGIVKGGFKDLSKHSLDKASRTSVPPSGTSNGVIPGTARPKGKEGRMAGIVESLG